MEKREASVRIVPGKIEWSHPERLFRVVARLSESTPDEDSEFGIRAQEFYSVHIRRLGEEGWGPGVIIPVTTIGLSNFDPGQEYECMVQVLDENLAAKEEGTHISRFQAPQEAS